MAKNKDGYKRMSVKDHTNILRKMNAIYNAANFLQENFVGKKVTYVGEESTVSVIFSHTNFMHLCGIDYRRGSALFFQDALVEKIDLQDVKIKIDSTVFCKTFLHNIAKKKYTPLRLKFFSDYFGLDRAFLSRKLSPVKLKMCA